MWNRSAVRRVSINVGKPKPMKARVDAALADER
jgi:hypothetical protein